MKKLAYLCAVSFLVLCFTLGHPTQADGQENKLSLSNNSLPQDYSIEAQSALTGPGKVVGCVVILSCLFFYFNRKK